MHLVRPFHYKYHSSKSNEKDTDILKRRRIGDYPKWSTISTIITLGNRLADTIARAGESIITANVVRRVTPLVQLPWQLAGEGAVFRQALHLRR